jgi:hypothetical protein
LFEQLVRRRPLEGGEHVGLRQPLPLLKLAEDVIGAHRSVLQVGAGFPLEAQRLLDVEHNQLAARVLQHEVADRGYRDLRTDALALVR